MLTVADTAYAIAHVRAAEGRRPENERLFDDPYAAIFDAAGEHAREGTALFRSLPFMADGVRLRTRFIDDVVRAALGDGIDQLVLLGAGFDARGLRLPEVAARRARVYEVDFAHLLATKRALLEKAGVPLPASIAYVPCDFTDRGFDVALAADLARAGFARDRRAVVVWEGVIGYIDDATIDRTLRFIAGLAGQGARGSRLVFTYGNAELTGGEPMEPRAKRCGFASCDDLGFEELWRRYWTTPPHEHCGVARIGVAHFGTASKPSLR